MSNQDRDEENLVPEVHFFKDRDGKDYVLCIGHTRFSKTNYYRFYLRTEMPIDIDGSGFLPTDFQKIHDKLIEQGFAYEGDEYLKNTPINFKPSK